MRPTAADLQVELAGHLQMAYGPEPLPELQHALVVLINPCNLPPHLDYHLPSA
jgi:hypothetical protein